MKGMKIDGIGLKKKHSTMMKDIGIDNMGIEISPTKSGRSGKIYPSLHIDRPPKGLKKGDRVVMHGHVAGVNDDEYGTTVKVKVKKMGKGGSDEQDS